MLQLFKEDPRLCRAVRKTVVTNLKVQFDPVKSVKKDGTQWAVTRLKINSTKGADPSSLGYYLLTSYLTMLNKDDHIPLKMDINLACAR